MNNKNNNIDKTKFDRNTIDAAKKGDTSALINKLSSEDRQKLNEILNDKKALADILKSPQAAAIMKAFGGKNG